jgi:hypothetical protein
MRKKPKKRVSPPLHSWASDAREQVVASDCHEQAKEALEEVEFIRARLRETVAAEEHRLKQACRSLAERHLGAKSLAAPRPKQSALAHARGLLQKLRACFGSRILGS